MKPAIELKELLDKEHKEATSSPPPPVSMFALWQLLTLIFQVLLLEHPWQYIITHAWSHFTNLLLDQF